MPTTTTPFPLATYPAGTRNFGPIAVPNGLSGFNVSVQRCTDADPTIWPSAAVTVRLDLQFSYDGGNTWTPIGDNSAGPAQGGIMTNEKTGAQYPAWVCGWRFKPDEPTHLKGQITVAGGPIRTSLSVTRA